MPLTDSVAQATAGGTYQTAPAQSNTNYTIAPPKPEDKLKTEQKWDYKTATTGPEGQPLPAGAIGWRPDGEADFGTGIEGWQKRTKYKLSTAWNDGWKEGERIAEDAGYENDFMQRLVSSWSLAKAGVGSLAEPLFAGLNVGAQFVEQVGGTAGYALRDVILRGKDLDEIDWKGNWGASRLAYNELMRPFLGKSGELRDEFNERMANGETADIIAEDMLTNGTASPWLELAGQLLADPLNALGKVGKVKKTAQLAKIARGEMAVVEVAEVADKINDVLKIENKAMAIDKISDLRKTILETQDAVGASMAALAKPGMVDSKNIIKRMKDLVKYTPDSRNQIVFNRSSVMLETWMTSLGNNGAKMTDLLRAVMDFRGADEAKSVNALINLLDSGVSPNMLFSPAGNDTMLIMEKMMSQHGDSLLNLFGKEAKVTKKITAAAKAGKIDEVAKLEKAVIPSFEANAQKMLEVMKQTTDSMFPTAKKILEAEAAVKAGAKGEEVERLAALAKQMKPYERKVAAIHNMLQDEKTGPVKILNKMYAKIYLGISPGYAFRNMTQNRFQMWLDYGPKMLFGSGDDALAKASKMHGMPLLAGEGFGNADPRGIVKSSAGTDFWSGIKKWVTGDGDWKKIGDTRVLAANDEAWASRKIVGEMYQKSFREALEPMIKSVMKEPRFKNLSPQMAASLQNELYTNFGDVNSALKSLKKKMAVGFERPFQRYDKLPKALQAYLSKSGYESQFIQEVLNANSSDEALDAANKLFDRIGQEGIPSYTDGLKANLEDDIERAYAVGQYDGDVGFATVRAKTARIRVADQTVDKLTDLVQRASKEGGVLAEVQNRYIAPITGWTQRRNEVRFGVDSAVKIIKGDLRNLQEAWTDLRKILDIPADVVAPVAKDDFIDLAWKQIDRYSNAVYNEDLLSAMDNVAGFIDEIGLPQYTTELDELRKNFEAYTNLSIAEGGILVSEKPLVGTRPNIIRQIAGKYGISSVSEAGAPMDKMLVSILNKYSGVDGAFRSLDDPIAIDLVNRAFAKYSKQEEIVLGKVLPAGEETLLKLADSYGVPEGDILKLVNESLAGISETFDPEVDINVQNLLRSHGGLTPEIFSDIFGGYYGKDKTGVMPGLFAGKGKKGMNIDAAGRLLAEYHLITPEQGDDYGFVMDFIRKNAADKPITYKASYEYEKLSDIPEYVAKKAFEDAGYETAQAEKAVNKIGGVDVPENVLKVPTKEPSYSALIAMNNPKAQQDALEYISANFGKMEEMVGAADEAMLADLAKELNSKLGEVRAVSQRVAMAHRDFTLLNYGEQTYTGVMASYLFPYYKWYAGTYSNYASRIMSNPAILGHYGMIKDRMAQIHSDLQDWWKYNLSTNDLPEPMQNAVAGVQKFFGMEQQPLFVNIESLLWPLQGLTGTDFNDQEKVVNWWTYTLDQIGKYGPSTWTPLSLATGMKLIMDGEQEAGERWVGRLTPLTATIKSITSALEDTKVGQALGIKTTEIDPLVNLFMGGIDPYERKRVRRALGDMMMNNPDSEFQAQAIDAAYNQSGKLWDEAVRKAGQDRLLGNVMSSMFGVGLKTRTESDMQIDLFYTEYGKLMQMRPNMSPEDFRNQMALLGEKYPFMDAVLIGSKTEEKRDAAFAFNVLSRVPPGNMSELLNFVGVRQDSVDYFYENKGDLSKLSPDDRMRFNAAMLSLAAILKIPDKATKQEWNTAKYQYSQAQQRAGLVDADGNETAVGEKLQTYYSLMDEDARKAGEYLQQNPDLQRAMDLKNAYIANTPTLNAYYGGIETIEKYYQSQVRATMVEKYGEGIYQKWDYYNNILDPKAKSAYLKENPDLKAFKEERGTWQEEVNRQVGAMAARMPDAKLPEFRVAQTQTQEALQQMVGEGQRPVSSQELYSQMSPELAEMVRLYAQTGQELTYQALQQLDYLGGWYGLNGNEVLQVILAGQ